MPHLPRAMRRSGFMNLYSILHRVEEAGSFFRRRRKGLLLLFSLSDPANQTAEEIENHIGYHNTGTRRKVQGNG